MKPQFSACYDQAAGTWQFWYPALSNLMLMNFKDHREAHDYLHQKIARFRFFALNEHGREIFNCEFDFPMPFHWTFKQAFNHFHLPGIVNIGMQVKEFRMKNG